MDLRELEYFITIAECRSLTSAAETLFISQSTLSKYLSRLEQSCGVKLFEYVNHSMRLTEPGKEYLSFAKQMLTLSHDLDLAMLKYKAGDKGTLKIGIPPVRSGYMLSFILPKFKEAYPNIDIQIIENNSTALEIDLIDGEIDLAIYLLSTENENCNYEYLMKDEIYAVLPPNHPIKEKAIDDGDMKCICLPWLIDETFLLQNAKQRHGQIVYNYLKKSGVHPTHIKENSNILAGVSLAANGYGVSFISKSLARYVHHNKYDRYRLLDFNEEIRLVAAWRKNTTLSEPAQHFVNLVKEHVQQ